MTEPSAYSGVGAEIENGTIDSEGLSNYMLEKGEIDPNRSGRQEMLMNLVNRYL